MTNTSRTRRNRASASGLTSNLDAFHWVRKKNPERFGVLIEGDSWFAYPPDWLIYGEASNVITSLFSSMAKKKALIGYCVASNGDTAKEMMNGSQLKSITKLLKKNGHMFDMCLFSAGGNDVVGTEDLLPLLNKYKPGFTAQNV